MGRTRSVERLEVPMSVLILSVPRTRDPLKSPITPFSFIFSFTCVIKVYSHSSFFIYFVPPLLSISHHSSTRSDLIHRLLPEKLLHCNLDPVRTTLHRSGLYETPFLLGTSPCRLRLWGFVSVVERTFGETGWDPPPGRRCWGVYDPRKRERVIQTGDLKRHGRREIFSLIKRKSRSKEVPNRVTDRVSSTGYLSTP